MVAVFAHIALLAFMPHAPAPPLSAVQPRSAISPVPQLPVYAAPVTAPRCPAVEAAEPLQALAAVAGLVVFGGLPFILASLQPPPSSKEKPPAPPPPPPPEGPLA